MALFRMAFFRLFALVLRHFAWRISFFRLFAWLYFVFSLFRLAFFRYFVFSLGVISSWRRAITPGEKTKERNNEMAQTSQHTKQIKSGTRLMSHDKRKPTMSPSVTRGLRSNQPSLRMKKCWVLSYSLSAQQRL